MAKVIGRPRLDQTNQLQDESKNFINQYAPASDSPFYPMFEKYTNPLIEKGEVLEEKFMQSRAKSNVGEAEKNCDKTFIALGNTLQAQTYMADQDISNKSNILYQIWLEFGYETTRMDIESELSRLKKFIKKFNSPEVISIVNEFPTISMFLNQLQTQTLELETNKLEYETKITIQRSGLNATEAKDDYLDYFRGPFWLFLQFWAMEEPEVFGQLHHAIQGSINRINEVIKLRSTLAAKEEEEEEPSRDEEK